MRSRISVLAAALLGVVASGCTYGSAMEAETACRKWIIEGGKATWTWEVPVLIGSYERTGEGWIRSCKEEPKTSQWLGLSRVGLKPFDVVLKVDEVPAPKVVKRFRYPSR